MAAGTEVFTFLVLGDQNAGKSTLLHSFTYVAGRVPISAPLFHGPADLRTPICGDASASAPCACVHVNCRSLLQACGGQELHGADGRAAVPKQHLRQHTVSTSTPIRIVDCRRSDDRSNQTNRIGSVLTTLGRRCVMEGRPMDEPPFLDTDLGEKSASLLPPAIPPSAVLCEHSLPQRCNPSAADGADRLHQCAFLGRS